MMEIRGCVWYKWGMRIYPFKNTKRILTSGMAAVCFLVIISLTVLTLRAEDDRVIDTYGLFSGSQIADLESACAQFEEQTGIRTAILSVDSGTVGGYSDRDSIRYIEAYADSLQEPDFIGLLINMDARYYYIDVRGDTALRIYTDSRQEQLGNAVVEQLSLGNYASAGRVFLSRAAQLYSYAVGNQSYGTIVEEKNGFQAETLGMAAVFGALFSGIFTGVRARRHKEKKMATEANRYIVPGTINLHRNRNVFVSQYVTRVPIAKKEDIGGGGGGFTTTHMSGGGSMHSGHGGHF